MSAEPCLFSDDATGERLTSHVAEQNGRCAVLSPQGEIFSIAAGRYSGAPNFAVLKSGHAGEQMRIDRMGRPAVCIDAAIIITLGICTQPGVLTRLGDTPQFREQGLLGRLLYSVPESLLGYRNAPRSPSVTQLYDAIGEYFTVHAQAAYDTIGADPAVADTRALLDWIRRTSPTRFTARDVAQALRSRFAKVADTDPARHILESHGCVRRVPSPPRTGPPPTTSTQAPRRSPNDPTVTSHSVIVRPDRDPLSAPTTLHRIH